MDGFLQDLLDVLKHPVLYLVFFLPLYFGLMVLKKLFEAKAERSYQALHSWIEKLKFLINALWFEKDKLKAAELQLYKFRENLRRKDVPTRKMYISPVTSYALFFMSVFSLGLAIIAAYGESLGKGSKYAVIIYLLASIFSGYKSIKVRMEGINEELYCKYPDERIAMLEKVVEVENKKKELEQAKHELEQVITTGKTTRKFQRYT